MTNLAASPARRPLGIQRISPKSLAMRVTFENTYETFIPFTFDTELLCTSTHRGK